MKYYYLYSTEEKLPHIEDTINCVELTEEELNALQIEQLSWADDYDPAEYVKLQNSARKKIRKVLG